MRALVNRLFLSLVLILPWHSLIVNGYLRKYFSLIVLWKELAVVALFILAVTHKGPKMNGMKLIILLSTIFLLTAHLVFNSMGVMAAYSYRIYLLPVLMTISLYKLADLIDWEKIAKWFIAGAFVMAIFTTIQQLFLGESIYLNAGYPVNTFSDEKLNFTFYIGYGLLQRGAGGFIAPIPYSVYLILALVLSFKYKELFSEKFSKVLNMVLTISLVLTFTRSTIAAYLFFFVIPYLNFFTRKTVKYLFALVFIVIIQFFLVPASIQEMELSTIDTFWSNSTSLEDTSSAGHFESLDRGFKIAWDNIGNGIGLGKVGAHTAAFFDNALVIESGYLSVIIELGLLTAVFVYLSFPLVHYKKGSLSTVIILVYLAVSFLLPLIYYVELSLLILITTEALNKDKNLYVDNSRKSVAGSFS